MSGTGKLVVIALMAVGRIGVLGLSVALAVGLRRREASAQPPSEVAL